MVTQAHRIGCVAGLLLLAVSLRADAILVSAETVSCPICGGEVEVTRVAGWGAYVFEEPSKYDMVYAPATRPDFIETCRTCGYSQAGEEFLSVTPEQIEKLKAAEFMRSWKPVSEEPPFPERLERTILVNQTLERPKEFWARFNRVLICHFREIDPERAARIAKEELDLVRHDPHLMRKQEWYLLGEYSRLAGDPEAAERYFRKAARTSMKRDIAERVVIFNVGCAALSLGVAYVVARRFRKRIAWVYAIVAVAVVLFVTVRGYAKVEVDDDYYDRIIADRMALLTGPDDAAGEIVDGQPSEGADEVGFREDKWVNAEGQLGGQKAHIRKNVSAARAKADSPYVTIVTLSADDVGDNGLPSSQAELEALDRAEEMVADLMCDDYGAVFALAVTCDGTRDLFFYSPVHPDEAGLESAIDSLGIPRHYDFDLIDDPEWGPYERLGAD